MTVRRAPAGTATCRDGTALAAPESNPGLVRDCETLLSAKGELDPGGREIFWGTVHEERLDLGEWFGVTVRDGRVRELAWDGVEVADERLAGTVPSGLSGLDALEVLDLWRNDLRGGIPESLKGLSSLRVLDLRENELDAAPLPAWLGEMGSLRELRLDAPAPGPIPAAWSSLAGLEDLGLTGAWGDGKGATGPIPEWLGELGSLRRLRLPAQRLTGRIPLGLARGFDDLDLRYNALEGCVPAQLADAENVKVSRQGTPRQPEMLPACALVVDAGAGREVSAGATVELSATAAGHHGDATLVWSWTQESGPPVSLSGAATASASFAVPARGVADQEFAFSVSVSDAEATSGSATAAVAYRLPGFAGTAAPAVSGAGSHAVVEGDTAVATLAASDPDTAASRLSWRLSGGSDASHFALGGSGSLSFVSAKDYEAPDDADGDGTYAVSVEVSDGLRSATADLTVALVNRNEAPTAEAGPDQSDVSAGATVTLSGSATDPDAGDTLTHAWTQMSGASVELSSPGSASTTFAAPASGGALAFRLRATDAGGLWGEDEVTVTVVPSVTWGDRLSALDVELSDIGIASGVWSDGDTVWVSDWEDPAVRAYALDGGARRSGKDLTELPATRAAGLWSDGSTLWVADFSGAAVQARDLSTGAAASGGLADLDDDGNDAPTGIWSDGSTLWVSDYYDRKAYAYALSDGARASSRDVPLSGASRPFGLWSQGGTLLAADWTGGRVLAYRLSDGTRLAALDIDTSASGNAKPMGLWSDGETLWVSDEQDDRLYAYAVPAPPADTAPAPVVAPLAATGLVASAATATTVSLSWTLPAQPEGVTVSAVEVQRETAGSWTTAATLGAAATTHTATGLAPSTSYTFRVRLATNRGTAESASVTASTAAAAPLAATGLVASGATATTVSLSWTLPSQPAGVTVTAVEVQRETAGSWTTAATLGATATTHVATGLEAGTAHRFRIRLATGSGDADSAAVTASTEAASPVAGFTLVDGDDGADIGALRDGDELAAGLGALEIRADLGAGESVGSVHFALGGAKTVERTENLAPYELFGGQGGEAFGAGTYTLTATPYAERGLGGAAGVAASVSFTVSAPKASVDRDRLALAWRTPRDAFAAPHGSDFAVSVDGAFRAVASASVSGSGVLLALSAPVLADQTVLVDYLGSAMHPLADARGVEVGAWTGLAAENVTGRAAVGIESWLAVRQAPAGRGGVPPWPAADSAPTSLSLASAGLADGDLARLAGMAGLKRLDLSGNALTDVSALSGLTGLASLDLSDNGIADLWPLASLTALRRLDVSGNRIADLSPLSELPRLEVLVADANLVTDAGALTHLVRLEEPGSCGQRGGRSRPAGRSRVAASPGRRRQPGGGRLAAGRSRHAGVAAPAGGRGGAGRAPRAAALAASRGRRPGACHTATGHGGGPVTRSFAGGQGPRSACRRPFSSGARGKTPPRAFPTCGTALCWDGILPVTSARRERA